MRTALIGPNGQLGTALRPLLEGDVIELTHRQIDIADAAAVRHALASAAPDVVINAAAYNLVDQAEDDPQAAWSVNAIGPRNLALACRDLGAALVHVSTDFVFGLDAGRTQPYREDDAPGPLSAYGVSKLAGEYHVRSICPMHYVVRTCGLYGQTEGSSKRNFVDSMLRLGAEREELSVVDDHFCTPTSAADLARVLVDLVKSGRFGLYHATNAGSTTWCRLAREIFRQAALNVRVKPISSAEYKAKARRPHFSVLDSSRLAGTLGYALPTWQDALAKYLENVQR